jgi:hypothetical protein
VAKQKQVKMQMQVGALAAIPQLESRSDEQLQSESKHRVAAKVILATRAAERYDARSARRCCSSERPRSPRPSAGLTSSRRPSRSSATSLLPDASSSCCG